MHPNPHSKEELQFMVNEWRRQPLTTAFINHMRALEAESFRAAVHGRRDHQISLQKLERASLLAELLDTLNNGTFIK